jgi:large subunit ribosomal protein L30
MSDKTLKITLVRSAIGYSERQKRTVRALGLRKMNQSVTHKNTPAILGMISKVVHLVSVEEVENDETA